MIHIQNVVGGYTKSPIIKGIDLEIRKGEFFALLGPNGSGKTTLFKLITGQLPINSGKILISGKEIASFSKLEKAKKMAVLTQEVQVSFDYTVEEIVSLGRYPHQKGILKKLSKEDWKVIEEVMEITKINDFRKKQFRMISGGEKQRVLLAKALAQEPELLLLDEPTNHLDIKHTFQLLDLLKEHQQTKGLTIFSILHDLNVASLYADRFALLHNGSLLEVGDVDLLRKEEQLKKVYQVQVNAQSHPTIPKPQLLMTPSYATYSESLNFENSYKITQTPHYVHVAFKEPLRTISNSTVGDGIQWLKHFCHVYVTENKHDVNPKEALQRWMEDHSIPYKQTGGVITIGHVQNIVIEKKEIDKVQVMSIVTSGGGNISDVSNSATFEGTQRIHSMNTMLFIDAHMTDGDLVNGYRVATEAKMKALQELNGVDSQCHHVASKDTLLLAVTQQEDEITSCEVETSIEKAIRQVVYSATQAFMKRYC